MATNINFDKKLGVTGGTGISLPSSSTPPSFASTNSFSFDGVDDFFLGTSTYSELNGTTKATWSIWLKPNLSGTGIISRVSTSTSSSAFVYQFFVLPSGEVLMQIGDTTRRARTGTSYLTANVWSHILVCYDGTLSNGNKTKIFVNGIDSTSTDGTTATSLNPANYSLQIGRRDFGTGTNYGGLMDEFAIWSGTDQRANVSEIYNGGTPNDLNTLPTATQPTTWQRMGEGATWNGFAWTMTDVNGGYTNRGVAMVEANRTTDVPSPPFNVYSTTFDGVDDYVDIGDFSAYDTGDLSASVWVYKTTTVGVPERVITNSASSSKAGIDISVDRNENVYVGRNTRTSDTASGYINIGFTINNWHNISATYQDSTRTLKIYLDGVLKFTKIGSVSVNSASIPLSIGCYSNGVSQFWTGDIDEVSLFNSELSQSDITSIYGSGVPTSLSTYASLISWWRMGDGDTYPTITDNKGSNNGTMTNMSSANFVTDVPT